MNKEILKATVARLVAEPKGILAIDESTSTCQKRFEKLGIPFTEEKRRDYRELLITAPEIEKYVSGYILFDETIRQSAKDGRKFSEILKVKGIEPGIKVDTGLKDLPDHAGEKLTLGLEGLALRLKEYKNLGATFAKWRAVYSVGINLPSEECMKTNAKLFADYALACQAENIVPIVEPEILIDGTHTIEECYAATTKNLDVVFKELLETGVYMPGLILKTSMVLPGKDGVKKALPEEVAAATLKCLDEHVPREIGGIVFLSGGMADEDATLYLNAMHKGEELPWPLTFSYGRAIQNEALKSWAKNPEDVDLAQKLLLEAAKRNSLASIGQYK